MAFFFFWCCVTVLHVNPGLLVNTGSVAVSKGGCHAIARACTIVSFCSAY